MSLLVRLLFWTWFGAALAAGHYQWLQRMPPVALQGITFALAGLLLAAYFRIAPFRAWVDNLDLRALVLAHLTRFVGFYLLVLYQRGELPRAFAMPAGVGDIFVATMALPIAFAPLADSLRLRAMVIWNIFGLVDLLLVIVTAARLNLTEPALLRPLTQLPLSLLPTFLMPLLLATHVMIFARAVRR